MAKPLARVRVVGRVHTAFESRDYDFKDDEGRTVAGTIREVVVLDEDANKAPIRFEPSQVAEAQKLTVGTEGTFLCDIMSGKLRYVAFQPLNGK